jgi:hypothetical protein
MKTRWLCVALFATALPTPAAIAKSDPVCAPLRAFVASVGKDDKRTLEFHTSWGSNFKNDPEPAIAAKQCIHGNYAPAQAACAKLMEHGATEFAGYNFRRALLCLSPKTRLDRGVSFQRAQVQLTYGDEHRGGIVDMDLVEDETLGGMVLKIAVDGY